MKAENVPFWGSRNPLFLSRVESMLPSTICVNQTSSPAGNINMLHLPVVARLSRNMSYVVVEATVVFGGVASKLLPCT